jgi:hypothetical protein
MKRHDLDVISLLFGSVFFLLGGVFLIGGTTVPGSNVGALWPIPLIALGLVIALTAARALVRERPGQETPEDRQSRD